MNHCCCCCLLLFLIRSRFCVCCCCCCYLGWKIEEKKINGDDILLALFYSFCATAAAAPTFTSSAYVNRMSGCGGCIMGDGDGGRRRRRRGRGLRPGLRRDHVVGSLAGSSFKWAKLWSSCSSCRNGLSPTWIFMWLFSVDDCRNSFLHTCKVMQKNVLVGLCTTTDWCWRKSVYC